MLFARSLVWSLGAGPTPHALGVASQMAIHRSQFAGDRALDDVAVRKIALDLALNE